MTTTAEALSAQAAQLPPAERMEVVERILDSLDQPDAALDTLWAKEQRGQVLPFAYFRLVTGGTDLVQHEVPPQHKKLLD